MSRADFETNLFIEIEDLKKDLRYWKSRCKLAEKFISESPCDPDIYPEQMKAYNKWQKKIKKLPKKK